MSDDVKNFDELVRQFERLEAPKPAGTVAKADICSVWRTVKPGVELGIKILRALPFGWARKLADLLQHLDDALNAICA